jgi:hypothetical protein
MFLRLSFLSLVATATLFAAGSFDLDKAKQKATDKLDKEIKVLQDAKTCVNAAKNQAEFKACREKAKIDLKAVKASKE